jgi:hypothetical protein
VSTFLAVIERKQRLKYFINETDIIYFKKCFIFVTGIFVTKINGGETFLFIYPLDHSDAIRNMYFLNHT